MKTLNLIFLLNIIPAMVFAGNVSMSGTGEDCSNRRDPFAGMSAIQKRICEKAQASGYNTDELGCNSGGTSVAWYQDRDNLMSDANDEVGDAMAVVLGPNGTATQAVQVCPGVYLATAHGALDSPITARENKRPVMDPGKLLRVIHYPMVKNNLMRQKDSSKFISPRLRDPSLWNLGNEETDYVFIKVDAPVRPNAFVTPLNVTPEELVQNRSSVDVNMYRGKSKYQGAESGRLQTEVVNGREQAISHIAKGDTRALAKLFQNPQKVNISCSISGTLDYNSSYVSHNCPTEQGTSGASYVSKVNGKNYLTGIHTMGSSNNIESSENAGGSTMLTSSSFCVDYQTACGQPCPSFKDTHKKNSDSVSL